ncbi:hypothetical protein P9279_22110 [Mesorhizobium sp. WSM4962]|uniref:hypothetical protein n=1 Tax=Mesorhizobium sp. WSM4962 TaxID=3038548 RepID=UPI0024164856|nr:hypothetical protein [Mesorhizobium sp. WSM4962]MDG4903208.1 hypothetical protein [Mesorhizobium sp. WSM4962]
MASAWGSSWASAWGNAWGVEGPPVIASLVLGAISIRPLLGASVAMKTALAGDVDVNPLLAGKIRMDEP